MYLCLSERLCTNLLESLYPSHLERLYTSLLEKLYLAAVQLYPIHILYCSLSDPDKRTAYKHIPYLDTNQGRPGANWTNSLQLAPCWSFLLSAVQVQTKTHCRFLREQLSPVPLNADWISTFERRLNGRLQ